MRTTRLVLVCFASLAFLAPAAGAAASSADYRRGVKALEAGDYPLALRYLEAAREAEPLDADLLRALGRSHAGIGGHEIPAIVYLRAAGRVPGSKLDDEILTLETKLDSRVDKMMDAALEGLGALEPDDRLGVVHRVVEALARAGRLEMVPRAARQSANGWGTTAAVARVAVERAKQGRTTEAGMLFDLARDVAENDMFATYARASAAVPPPLSDDPVAVADYEKRKAEAAAQEERWRQESLTQSRIVCGAMNWMYLALIEDAAGFHRRARREWEAGRARYGGNAGGMPPQGNNTKLIELLPEARLQCYVQCNVDNGKVPAGGDDPAASTGAPRVAWKDVAAGKGPIDVRDPELADIAEALDKLGTTATGANAPRQVAEYASRVAEAAWFLKSNRGAR